MRLTDLNPRWIGCGGNGIFDKDGNSVLERTRIGVMLDCPICGKEHPLAIFFTNPSDGGPPIREHVTWNRVGEDFETMTLTPSIARMEEDRCKWHGFITNGEIITY